MEEGRRDGAMRADVTVVSVSVSVSVSVTTLRIDGWDETGSCVRILV